MLLEADDVLNIVSEYPALAVSCNVLSILSCENTWSEMSKLVIVSVVSVCLFLTFNNFIALIIKMF